MTRLICFILTFVFLSQTAAFAVDPAGSSLSNPEAILKMEALKERMGNRYESLSTHKKVKFLNRTEKRLSRFKRKIVRMSDQKFNKLMNRKIEIKETDVELATLSPEEKTIFASTEGMQFDQKKMNAPEGSVDRKILNDKIDKSLEDIRLEKINLEERLSKNSKQEINRLPANCTTTQIAGALLFAGGILLFIFGGPLVAGLIELYAIMVLGGLITMSVRGVFSDGVCE